VTVEKEMTIEAIILLAAANVVVTAIVKNHLLSQEQVKNAHLENQEALTDNKEREHGHNVHCSLFILTGCLMGTLMITAC
jgi:hypothetical protein